jgi:hypothetical protein
VRRFDHVVLHIRSKPVLRPEQRRHLDRRIVERGVHDVPKTMIDGGRIAHETDPLAAKPSGVEKASGAECDRHA